MILFITPWPKSRTTGIAQAPRQRNKEVISDQEFRLRVLSLFVQGVGVGWRFRV